MENKVLILIDCQNDFIDGNLAVNGSFGKMEELAKYIRERGGEYAFIIASADFHPMTHCSFGKNSGIWPTHCIQHSHGAAIFQPILDAIDETGIEFHVLTKGLDEDHEEYSVLKNAKSNKELHALIETNGVNTVDFTGIAGDYCVLDSASDFHREFPDVKINMLLPFIASIDDGTKLNEFIRKNDSINSIDTIA